MVVFVVSMVVVMGCRGGDSYTVTFVDWDSTVLDTQEVEHSQAATAPTTPQREGHTFAGWNVSFSQVTADLTVMAEYDVNLYDLIYYEADGTTVIQIDRYPFGADLSAHQSPDVPEKQWHIFVGWDALPSTMPANDVIRVAMYAYVEPIDMVQVGELDTHYLVPLWIDDSETVTVTGGFLMATTQTTYELWYDVKVWAKANGYYFQNQGQEGSQGDIGQPPTSKGQEPVTQVSWRDAIVWLNAFSERRGLEPVYRDDFDNVIKDSRDANGAVVDNAIETDRNGYRLPTSYEWDMAARWKHDTESTDGSILVGDRYWTPGHYASGATDDYNNEAATRAVSWYWGAPSGNFTKPVGQLLPNHLGIYDMSGNVWEWTFTMSDSERVARGGCWYNLAYFTQVGYTTTFDPSYIYYNNTSFRIVRNP